MSAQTKDAPVRTVIDELRSWPARRWGMAVLIAAMTIIVVAVPTVLIPNPWFSREIPPTAWAWPVLVVTGVLSGLVMATYVARKDTADERRTGVIGSAGAVTSFFAVGCPVCNKLVLLALGYAGALQFFEPLQPYLAAGSILLLGAAFVMRVRRERSCPLTVAPPATEPR